MTKKHKSRSSATARKSRIKHTKHTLKSVGRAKRGYNQQTGQATGREIKALKRVEALTQEYIQEGMDPGSAKQRAVSVMRDNPRRDWRGG